MSRELFDSLEEKQKKVLLSVSDLGLKEKKLCDEINAKKPTESGTLFTEGAVTVCEDEDDWLIITLKERKELDKVKDEIAKKLNEALDLGLGFLGLVQRQCENYKVKV